MWQYVVGLVIHNCMSTVNSWVSAQPDWASLAIIRPGFPAYYWLIGGLSGDLGLPPGGQHPGPRWATSVLRYLINYWSRACEIIN